MVGVSVDLADELVGKLERFERFLFLIGSEPMDLVLVVAIEGRLYRGSLVTKDADDSTLGDQGRLHFLRGDETKLANERNVLLLKSMRLPKGQRLMSGHFRAEGGSSCR
jgi:hypothetical protein